jgi:hypothetical protein
LFPSGKVPVEHTQLEVGILLERHRPHPESWGVVSILGARSRAGATLGGRMPQPRAQAWPDPPVTLGDAGQPIAMGAPSPGVPCRDAA